jgi:hypothetical protein
VKKKTILVVGVGAALLAGTALGTGLLDRKEAPSELGMPEGPPVVRSTPGNWEDERARRRAEKEDYLQQHQVAYDWFTRFPFSQVDGTPMILLKLLPEVSDRWPGGRDFMKNVGLFQPSEPAPLPVGIGFSGLASDAPDDAVDYTSFTCAACHIGRVETGEGLELIRGGVNAEFNINHFFAELFGTLDDLSGGASDPDIRKDKVLKAFLAALDEAEEKSPTYFYGDTEYNGKKFDAEYEARQIALFRENAKELTGAFVDYVDSFVGSFSDYLDKTYDGFQAEMLAGLPGMADATGVSASHGYEDLKDGNFISRLLGHSLLPDNPGITDFMPVWEQGDRTAEWGEGDLLVNGGGQYNGNIPIPIYRNLAASMTMGLKDTDLRVAAFAAELLEGLPAEPYPFDVDVDLARQGEELFSENCASCHQPHVGEVYDMGTDLGRAGVINSLLRDGAKSQYLRVCGPETEVVLYDEPVRPCESFDGKLLSGKEDVIMRPLVDQRRGYNPTPLHGVWATAPYLHAGSVPTMYHLLVPEERPANFVKGSLEYDTDFMGYAWQEGTPGGYDFDTRAFSALSSAGHDENITVDGKSHKLDWSDDIPGAMALIEYLKTL